MTEKPVSKRSRARIWRDTEADFLDQLAGLLPYPSDVTARLNKSAILRLSAAYLKMRKLEDLAGGTRFASEESKSMAAMLGGFLLSVDNAGLVLDASDQVLTILGHHQYEIVGMDIMEFLHVNDQERFFKNFQPYKMGGKRVKGQYLGLTNGYLPRDFTVRLKYKIMGKANKIKQTGYVGMQFRGVLKTLGSDTKLESVLVGVCYPFCLRPCVELDVFDTSCVMRYDINDRITHVNEGFQDIIGTDGKEFIGVYFGELLHPKSFAENCDKSLTEMFENCGTMIVTYNMITRDGRMYQGVSYHMHIYGPRGEKLFTISVDSIIRRNDVIIKFWPNNRDIVFLGDSFRFPGEQPCFIESYLEEVVNVDASSQLQSQVQSQCNDQHAAETPCLTPILREATSYSPEHVPNVTSSTTDTMTSSPEKLNTCDSLDVISGETSSNKSSQIQHDSGLDQLAESLPLKSGIGTKCLIDKASKDKWRDYNPDTTRVSSMMSPLVSGIPSSTQHPANDIQADISDVISVKNHILGDANKSTDSTVVSGKITCNCPSPHLGHRCLDFLSCDVDDKDESDSGILFVSPEEFEIKGDTGLNPSKTNGLSNTTVKFSPCSTVPATSIHMTQPEPINNNFLDDFLNEISLCAGDMTNNHVPEIEELADPASHHYGTEQTGPNSRGNPFSLNITDLYGVTTEDNVATSIDIQEEHVLTDDLLFEGENASPDGQMTLESNAIPDDLLEMDEDALADWLLCGDREQNLIQDICLSDNNCVHQDPGQNMSTT